MEKVNYIVVRVYNHRRYLSLMLLLLCSSSTSWVLPKVLMPTDHVAAKTSKEVSSFIYIEGADVNGQDPKSSIPRANQPILWEEELEEVVVPEPQLWITAQKSNTIKSYRNYLAIYPADIHSRAARDMIQKISAADEVASVALDVELKIARYDQNRLRAYQAYLNKKPLTWFLLRRNEAEQQIKIITTRIGSFNIIAEPTGTREGEVYLEIMHGGAQSPQEFKLELLQDGQVLPETQYSIKNLRQVKPHIFEAKIIGVEYGEHEIKVKHHNDTKSFCFSAPLRPTKLILKPLVGEKYELRITGSYGPFTIWYRTNNSDNFTPQQQVQLQLSHPQQRVFVLSRSNIGGLRGHNKVDLQIMNADGQNLGRLHDLIINAPRASNWLLLIVLIIGLLLTVSLAFWRADILAYLLSFPIVRVMLGPKSRSTRRKNN